MKEVLLQWDFHDPALSEVKTLFRIFGLLYFRRQEQKQYCSYYLGSHMCDICIILHWKLKGRITGDSEKTWFQESENKLNFLSL